MAIACFLLLTVPPLPPLPDFNVPRFLRRMALRTVLLAALRYLGMVMSSTDNINLGSVCVRWNDSGTSNERNYVAGLSSLILVCRNTCRMLSLASRLGLHELFDQGAADVADGDVGFLDALGVGGRDVYKEIDFGG